MPQVSTRRALDTFPRFVRTQMRQWKVPGVGVAIVRDDEVVLCRGFGYRNLARKSPATADTLFAIGSCTKAFTTMVMGMLVDEGKLDWDRPVREYLPRFALSDAFSTERLTPRDLVTHRSGLPRHDAVWYGCSASREELVKRLRHLEPTADLRTTYQYQNLMFMTAGFLIGQLTGSTWEEQVRERIFTPLGMTRSNLSVVDSQKADDASLPYTESRNRATRIPFRNIDNVGPAGSVNSSVTDMAEWVRFHLNGGKLGRKRLISAESLHQMHTPQMVAEASGCDEIRFPSYGLGWSISDYRRHIVISHGGSIDGFTARTAFLPHDGLGVVVLTNQGTALPQIVAHNAIDRLLGLDPVPWSRRARQEQRREKAGAASRRRKELAQRVRGTRPSHPLVEYAGTYCHPGYGTLTVRREGKRLMVSLNDRAYRASHYHYDVFELREIRGQGRLKLTFTAAADGRLTRVSIPLQEGTSDIVFEREEQEQ